MSTRKKLKDSHDLELDFYKLNKIVRIGQPVLPVVVQDWQTKEVLMLAYASESALELTLKRRIAVFWSTSRHKLWVKGETSGNMLKVKEVRVNCEQNSLLYLVEIKKNGGACHHKDKNGNFRKSCYYRKIISKDLPEKVIIEIIEARGTMGKVYKTRTGMELAKVEQDYEGWQQESPTTRKRVVRCYASTHDRWPIWNKPTVK